MKGRKAAVTERKKERELLGEVEGKEKKDINTEKKKKSKERIKHERQENSRICFQDTKKFEVTKWYELTVKQINQSAGYDKQRKAILR